MLNLLEISYSTSQKLQSNILEGKKTFENGPKGSTMNDTHWLVCVAHPAPAKPAMPRLLFEANALNKRSGIDRGPGVLINLTSIYKPMGWFTLDASLPPFTTSSEGRKAPLREDSGGTGSSWGSNVFLERHLEDTSGIKEKSLSNQLFSS